MTVLDMSLKEDWKAPQMPVEDKSTRSDRAMLTWIALGIVVAISGIIYFGIVIKKEASRGQSTIQSEVSTSSKNLGSLE